MLLLRRAHRGHGSCIERVLRCAQVIGDTGGMDPADACAALPSESWSMAVVAAELSWQQVLCVSSPSSTGFSKHGSGDYAACVAASHDLPHMVSCSKGQVWGEI